MRTVLTTFVLTFSFACVADPAMRTSAKRAPLLGKVKIVRTSGYGFLSEVQTKTMSFNKDGYSVDSFNNEGLMLCTYYVDRGKTSGGVEYKYNQRGILVKEYHWNSETEQNPQDTLYIIFIYDTSDKLVEERSYISGTKDTGRIKYTYLGEQLIAKQTVGGNINRTKTFKYNEKGQLIEENDNITTQYTYDDKGRIKSESERYSFGDLKTVYTYDEHNNEVLAEERVSDGSAGRRFVSEYIYDSRGNWTQCIEDFPKDFEGDPALKQMSIREIEYY
ncbi:hypothetical protein [Polluticoccus soli]|uniref:hypothetical protein n=1 Tax=Polluticoccus soli TaxID=3034150 RepID=UPI0023E2D16F|nr:hypothetical protein [Flavipsychrobacter sp. JY13-12]